MFYRQLKNYNICRKYGIHILPSDKGSSLSPPKAGPFLTNLQVVSFMTRSFSSSCACMAVLYMWLSTALPGLLLRVSINGTCCCTMVLKNYTTVGEGAVKHLPLPELSYFSIRQVLAMFRPAADLAIVQTSLFRSLGNVGYLRCLTKVVSLQAAQHIAHL